MSTNGSKHPVAERMQGNMPARILQVTTTFTAYIAVMPGEDEDEVALNGLIDKQRGFDREHDWRTVQPSQVPPGTAIWGPDHDFTREDFEP